MTPLVAVIGNGGADPERDEVAAGIGEMIAAAGCGLVCGGLGGVMAAASRGARSAADGGSTPIIAILPGTDKQDANPYADIVIPTGLGYARNLVVVLAADAVIAVGGQSGTLSEIAHAWQLGKPICALAGPPGWAARLAGRPVDDKRPDVIFEAKSVEEAAAWLQRILQELRPDHTFTTAR